ncbi:UNVERIFIED_ORG: type IV pilus assembly protein PilY1 [Comamonas terrigena]
MQTAIWKKLPRTVLCMLWGLVAGSASAQYSSDIDIYSAAGGSGVANVLFIIDNSANWNANNGQGPCYYEGTQGPTTNGKKFSVEQCALYQVIKGLSVGTGDVPLFNIAFMVFNETNVGTGARVIQAFTPVNAAGKTTLLNTVKNLTQNQSPSPSSYGLAMHEAYLYYAEKAPYGGQRAGTLPYDPNAFAGGKYKLNATAANCPKNYVILIANGPPQGDFVKDSVVQGLLDSMGGSTAQITYSSGTVDTKDANNWTDEYARFLRGVNAKSTAQLVNVTTHAIAVTGASSDKATYPAIYKGVASQGGGDFYEARTVSELTLALGDIFNRMQAVDSVFSAASLPVSVNAQGTYLNQIFMGMFRPDGNGAPRWRGNLKQYQFGYDVVTDGLFLAGANGRSAVSSTTGFIEPGAVSFWTQPSSFWANDPMGTPKSTSDSPDGEVVEKGGAAQMLRGVYATSQDARKVLTCVGCAKDTNLATNAATQFTVANSSNLSAVAADTTERNQLIAWVRGTDNRSPSDEKGPGGTTTIRSSVHGDVLHSRPAVINYGTDKAPNIVVFYGSNDGMLHAINGNVPADSADAGKELWGFIPQEFFPKFKRLRDQSPDIRLSTTTLASATPRDYFVDGPISIYQHVNQSGTTTKAMLYMGMRRGGRMVYALDVTDPSNPKFLWKKTSADTGFSQLGQTWSEPRLARIRDTAVTSKLVLIMGAGYDATAEDVTPPGTTTMGNAVLVLDAETGALLKSFATLRSVPADVSLLDSDGDGYIDRAYAVDTGGNLYRIDFETMNTVGVDVWQSFRQAALSSNTAVRKFFYAPSLVMTRDFTAIQVGSGDREKPLATQSSDAFFTVFDDHLTKGWTPPADFTPVAFSGLGQVGAENQNMQAGCYIPMANGEKVVNASTTFRGMTYFGTNRPVASNLSCTANLGEAKSYAAPLFCRAATSQILNGGGLPPSPVSGFVSISYTDSNGHIATKKKEFLIGAPNAKGSGIETSNTPSTINVPRKRRYWFEESAR